MFHVLPTLRFFGVVLCMSFFAMPVVAQSLKQDKAGQMMIDGVLITTGQKLPSGTVLDPWAPATDLTTFAAIARQRPTGCEADSILCWLADQQARDEKPVALDELTQQRKDFKERHRFFVREDSTGLWIANAKVGLRFDTTGGRRDLVSFYDLTHRIEMISKKPANGSPFRLQVLRYRKDGSTGVLNFGPQWRNISPDVSRVTEVDASHARSAKHELTVSEDQLLLKLNWQDVSVPESPGTLQVTATMRMNHEDSLTRWRASVEGQLPQAGLVKVRCPVMTHLGYAGENDTCYAWGSQRGIMKRSDTSVSKGTYPSSQWAIQYASLSFGPKTTLYAACHDLDANVKSFYVQPGQQFFLSADVPNTGVRGNATYSQPYDVAIGPIEGDWFDSAKQYRRWAIRNAPWATKPLQERKDVSHRMLKVAYWARCSWRHDDDDSDGDATWAFNQSMFNVPPQETVNWYQRSLKIPFQRLGAIHYGWQQQLWDTRLPYWTPQSAPIAEELQRETALGMSTYIYTNPCWFDPTTPGFNEAVKKDIVRNLDGSMYFEQYNAKMYMPNYGSETFHRVTSDLAQLAKKLGSNGIYYDQFSGMIRGGDYDPAKGLPSLGRGGNVLTKFQQQAMEKMRSTMGADFGFVSEYYCEPTQHLFDVQSITIHAEASEIPLIPAVYSGYVVQHGAGLDRQTRPTSSVVALGRNFLWGTSFGWTQFAAELRRNYTRLWLRQLVQLRIQLDDFLIYGQMIHPPAYASPAPQIALDDWYVHGKKRPGASVAAYETTLWQARDGRRALLVVNYDTHKHSIEFKRSDLFSNGRLTQAKLLSPSQGVSIAEKDDRFLVVLPPRHAAVVLLQ